MTAFKFFWVESFFNLFTRSYRFPEIFIQLNEIMALQEKLEEVISRAVDANLKNYGFYKKNVGHFVVKRTKRKR